MQDCKVNILGAEWEITWKDEKDDKNLNGFDGYCDRSVKKIVMANERQTSGFSDYKTYAKDALRHEIIHAFMIESGLDGNWYHSESYGQDETTVDWFAIQSPKIFKVFKELDLI